jgi:ABC-type transport system involved in cytochrome c biogenesis permease subunit
LDPSIHGLQPVLRSNLWLTIHVLTEVSSYAAFGLAWALGLITICYYLTAVYHRSPRYSELALPLSLGLPLLAIGAAGVGESYGAFGSHGMNSDSLFYVYAILAGLGGMASLGSILALGGEMVNRWVFRETLLRADSEASDRGDELVDAFASPAFSNAKQQGNPTPHPLGADDIRLTEKTAWSKLDVRQRAMQETAQTIKPLANFIYRAMQVGVLLIAAGTILGGVWADYSWGRFWGWDPKEVWALITLLVYLVPLHGRFAGWVNTFGLVVASIVCFNSVVMAWYGVNFVLGVGLHSYGFTEGGSQGLMTTITTAVLAIPAAGWWRRFLGYRELLSPGQ